jgi:hypothetical protein
MSFQKFILDPSKRPAINTAQLAEVMISKHPEWLNPERAIEFLMNWYLAIWFLSEKDKTHLYFMIAPVYIKEMHKLHKIYFGEPEFVKLTNDAFGDQAVSEADAAFVTGPGLYEAFFDEFEIPLLNFHFEYYSACAPKGAMTP